MSNYLPRTQKKRERQERLETDLRRLITRGADAAKLTGAAEEVLAARIRTVRAERQHCWALGSTARYDAEIAALQATTAESILAEFGVRMDGPTPPGGTHGGAGVRMTDDPALLAAVRDRPDDTPRLVYADWLEDHAGDGPDPGAWRARAEFIRVQCELARMPALPPVAWIRLGGPIAPHTPALFSSTFGRGDTPPDLKVGDVLDVNVHNPVDGEFVIRGARVDRVHPLDPAGWSDVVLTLLYDRDYYPGDRRLVEDLRERVAGLLDAYGHGCGDEGAAVFGVPP